MDIVPLAIDLPLVNSLQLDFLEEQRINYIVIFYSKIQVFLPLLLICELNCSMRTALVENFLFLKK